MATLTEIVVIMLGGLLIILADKWLKSEPPFQQSTPTTNGENE